MPSLNVSELNIVLSVLGAFTVIYSFFSVKFKQAWYLGEALPAMLIGICLGPIAAKFLDSERWGSAAEGQQNPITIGVMRVMIGIQLVMAGYQLPAKYQKARWREMLILLLPVMTTMWLCTTLCVLATVPKVTLLAALVIASCVTSTDPVLSQAVAKGPFADKYVPRPLREIISSEAGANDGFAFPFLMLAVYLMRHAEIPESEMDHSAGQLHTGAGGIGRQGGGVGVALQKWVVELFIIGTGGALGISDLLACFAAGSALNWDGQYLAETERRHDEVNSCIDVLLNFGGFMYLGTVIPWSEFHQPDVTGLTIPRLIGLGVLVMAFRRIPAILMAYKLMPKAIRSYKEAFFMGYFGPIGVGAVFYLEDTRINMFPAVGKGDEGEAILMRAIGPVIYWLVLFSVVFHGLSIPALNALYEFFNVKPIVEDAVEMKRKSVHAPLPSNAVAGDVDTFVAYNRFSRPVFDDSILPVVRDDPSPAGGGESYRNSGTFSTCSSGGEEKLRAQVEYFENNPQRQ